MATGQTIKLHDETLAEYVSGIAVFPNVDLVCGNYDQMDIKDMKLIESSNLCVFNFEKGYSIKEYVDASEKITIKWLMIKCLINRK